MREQNPAITLYNTWREIIRWRGEYSVDRFHETWRHHLKTQDNPGGDTPEDLKEKMLASHISRYDFVPLDYRMRLRVIGLSDDHLSDDRLFDDLDDWQPVISLYVGRIRIFTLWPDGKFLLDGAPRNYYQVFPRWTFLRTSSAAGNRVWLVHSQKLGGYHGWYHLKEKDWGNPIPYVRNYDLLEGCMYRVIPAENGHWKFDGEESSYTVTHQIRLEEGYRVAEKRYERHKRAWLRRDRERTKRNMIAMYVPRNGVIKGGLITGDEAVNRFAQNIRVYERPSRP